MPDDEGHCSRNCRSTDVEAREAAARYETVSAERVNDWLIDLLLHDKACVLDVGSGSGRDAAWLANLGHEVIAVEPSPAMRRECERLHPHNTFRLLADRLPDLSATFRTGLSFDFILVNAVWMFVAPSHRERAFRKLITLLKPGGKIAVTLRQGPVEVDRGMHPASMEEIERLARRHGAYLERTQHAADLLGRRQIAWTRIIVRVPDDGTGALPLIRRIVLNDNKSSTYKLALLRTICRVAHSAPGFAREVGDFVEVPLGMVALFWLRLYLPLLRANMPQNPNNTTRFENLGFAKAALEQLSDISPIDLRAGSVVSDDRRRAMHQSLRDACETIHRMPAAHLMYDGNSSDGDNRIFPVERGVTRTPNQLRLDGDYLWSFGKLSVPIHLWRAMQRYAVWIEPALVEEWVRLSLRYGNTQSRMIDEGSLRTTMGWVEPNRDVDDVRRRAFDMLDANQTVYCVWTGKALRRNSLDIDHCFPWSAWPCGDLWNLMPSSRVVNQHQKRDLLPNDDTLRKAKDRVVEWWDTGYRAKARLRDRFRIEATARLPAIGSVSDLEDVFVALELQRLRLSNDQQIPEWSGPN
ncbi:MAG: methyltransferase domain-containing protein [Gammaproteobacteria bacterium]|nr:methyltransferase domain-containing protein [Gammaproteobacteria bacterium]